MPHLYLIALALPAWAGEPDPRAACREFHPRADCSVIPITDGVPSELLRAPPSQSDNSFRIFEDASGPGWNLSSTACKKNGSSTVLTAADLCAATRKACKDAFGFEACLDGSPASKLARHRDPVLRARAFEEARLMLLEGIKSHDLQNDCCGIYAADSCERKLCVEQFAKVKINVFKLDAVDKTARTVEYDVGLADGIIYSDYSAASALTQHAISMDEGHALFATTRQRFQSAVLHELGHACQASGLIAERLCKMPPDRRAHADLAEIHKPLNFCNGSKSMTRLALIRHLGTETAACIGAGLLRVAAEKPAEQFSGKPLESVCAGKWLQEAFAEAKFFARRKSLACFAFECEQSAVSAERAHFVSPPRKTTYDCLLKDPKIVEALCEEPPTAGGTVTNGRGGR